ncbi:hypothetical protein ACS0TY_026169 [Phlomoides rotata]
MDLILQDPFPLHTICGFVWKNTEGQLSFLNYAVSVPPEIFTFSHSGRQLTYAFGHTFESAWACHDLLEVLCQLSERGHASLVRIPLAAAQKYCYLGWPNPMLMY